MRPGGGSVQGLIGKPGRDAKRTTSRRALGPPATNTRTPRPDLTPLFPTHHFTPQGIYKFHQYQVVGRHTPTAADPEPPLFRMKLWAQDAVKARSKFWYYLARLRKVKKANGQIVACNEIFEKRPTTVKNFGIWVRYASRTGEHNMYKEYRDTTLNGAVEQLYAEMASRHRVRAASLHIIKTATVAASAAKRDATKQFHASDIKFPLTTRKARASSRVHKTTFKAVRPNVAMH